MKKTIILAMVAALAMAPAQTFAKKSKTKYFKRKVVVEQTITPVQEQPKGVAITDVASQLNGEWTLVSMHGKPVVTRDRAYIFLDFKNHKFYGNNGCNFINGKFSASAKSMQFKDIITTYETCHNVTPDRNIMRAFNNTTSMKMQSLYNMDYLILLNSKGNELLTFKRLSLDLLDGAWTVKELNGTNISARNIRTVIDTDQRTIHANTGCNLINGIITIDPSKDFAIQFEDLKSSHNKCPNIDIETELLIALEQTESCKKINNHEMALLNKSGKIVVVLHTLDLIKERKAKQPTNY